jgi:hypothetical protein
MSHLRAPRRYRQFRQFVASLSGVVGRCRELSGVVGSCGELSGLLGTCRDLSGLVCVWRGKIVSAPTIIIIRQNEIL